MLWSHRKRSEERWEGEMRPSGERYLSWFLKDKYELSECYVPFIQQTFTDTLCLGLVWFWGPRRTSPRPAPYRLPTTGNTDNDVKVVTEGSMA